MGSEDDKLSPFECAAVELLIRAIQRQPCHDLPELQFSIKMLRKYADDPSPNLFSMAKIAFDDLESELRSTIYVDAHDLAVKSAAALCARKELLAITAKLGHGEPKGGEGQDKPTQGETNKAKPKSFTTPLLAAMHRGK